MVSYHKPIPKPIGDKKQESGMSGMLGAWVQAEKLMQIALMLPSAAFIGWLAGYGLDRWLHQNWMAMAGAVFGILAGLVGAVRMAIAYSTKNGNDDGNGNQVGGSGTES